MAYTDRVVANALAAVAASKALRERLLARRAEAQKQLEAPRPIYVLRKAGAQLQLPLRRRPRSAGVVIE
ncbi:hypothetical protein [Rhizobium sp. GN54]|uniref:hypothetical protein n=1 Tax=Rhizobium sp. GN54 TaxID=2898150 RepID=UPI001E49BD9C|nr:hypothetical protein [Rhizobium sp. GN54]MCD2184699.1 hypothetical protein [Rhizobium sp. GN54]